jgi:P27 family predicted phage terminase small subunit
MAGRGPSPAALAAHRAAEEPETVGNPDRPSPPKVLQPAGKALWRRLHAALPPTLRFSAKELELLRRACALADREAELRKIVNRDGLTTTGSMGQVVLHPAAQELRMVETALCGLVARISTEDTAGEVATPRQQRASHAARAKWARQDELDRKRRARG